MKLTNFQLIDVFGHGSNISLVYDFMDTDLEEIIRDRESIVLTPANIKAYMIMILTGCEYLHLNWILHRVRFRYSLFFESSLKARLVFFLQLKF
jgi:hypothetical protein